MKLLPRSIRGRLLASGALFTALALIFATVSVSPLLELFLRRGIDERLDGQVALLVRVVKNDGTIDRRMIDQIGPFTRHDAGWAWRIAGPDGVISSRTVTRVPAVDEELRARGRRDRPRLSRSWRGHRTHDGSFYYRVAQVVTPRGVVTVTAAAPGYIVHRLLRNSAQPLVVSMAALAGGLLLAMLAQLQLGLQPLRRLREALAEVRAGTLGRVPDEQPSELVEVVAELNGLIDQNAAALAHARSHVSNLAHGLKTPLSTLAVRLSEPGRDPDGSLSELVAQIDGAIRHHLGRARAASPGAPGRPQVPLRACVEGLATALSRIHQERGVRSRIDIAADLTVTSDAQDLDEMVGNLLDNAWKWAKTSVSMHAQRDGTAVVIQIEDDGPGLSAEAVADALIPGRRLDESGTGYGFGLPIARELAELHGGALALDRSEELGGLRATLTLPARAA